MVAEPGVADRRKICVPFATFVPLAMTVVPSGATMVAPVAEITAPVGPVVIVNSPASLPASTVSVDGVMLSGGWVGSGSGPRPRTVLTMLSVMGRSGSVRAKT